MALNREQPSRRKKIQARTPDQEPVAPTVAGQPQQSQVFDSLLDFASDPEASESGSSPTVHPRQSWFSWRQWSGLQKVLVAGITLVAGVLVYAALRQIGSASTGAPAPAVVPSPASQPAPVPLPARQPLAVTEQPLAPQAAESRVPQPEPLSLQMADKLYRSNDFDNALVMYDKLCRRLPATEQNQPMRDFLLLRMALCNASKGDTEQADSLLRTVALSRLPTLRAIARYHQSTTLLKRQRYLEAATRAYQTIALIELVDCDPAWAAAVQRQCQYLAAEAMTRNLLTLQNADGGLPPQLWSEHPQIDPFVSLDEAQRNVFLNAGRETLDQAALGPQIRPVTSGDAISRWSITCDGAPLEEMLARLAGNARLNIRWIDNGQAALDEEVARRRPVYLHLTSATMPQAITIAAGSVGLLANMDAQGNVSIVDPSSYPSLAEHTKLLDGESVALWQRFLLGAQDDPRVPNGHFALALIHAARDRLDESIAEYKLVANRFPRHALAPCALLYSGRLKVKLRDYMGAHDDLQQLIDLYPDTESSDAAALDLADATMKAGRYEEAAGLYRRVFNLGLSPDSQIESALGAGRCFYELQDHESAATWLNHYVSLARDQNRREFHSACLLLGKTYLALNNPQQAHAALSLALKGELSRPQYVETIATLVKTYIQQGLLVEALNVLEGTQGWQLSQQETIELLLLRAQVLRSIGLAEKAIGALAQKSPFLPSPELKGAVALELARCYSAKGDVAAAVETLGNALPLVPPGDLAQQMGCELVELCLQAHRPEQALGVCSQLLTHATGPVRQRLVRLQADAYRRQGEYNRAVAVLLSEPRIHARPQVTESGAPSGNQTQPVNEAPSR